jgi:hypothetical protein
MTKRQVEKHNGNDGQQQAQKQDYDKACNAHQHSMNEKIRTRIENKTSKK